jgi:hypothetical protein
MKLYIFIYFAIILIAITYSLNYKSNVRKHSQIKIASSNINWSPDSWTKLPVKQPPNYPDQVHFIYLFEEYLSTYSCNYYNSHI